ncbi:MAG: hypothetical protein K0R09_3458 [Clostridiales bacterium]|jgi:hypothetical protein|nr:hypothetical protein [Clostridiales bacterium]
MLLKPDEVTNLKKGRDVLVEINEKDVRVLKRNFCGVYEFFCKEDQRSVEYFEDLNLFKNRYGSIHKRFPLYNLSRQRLDVFPVTEGMDVRHILKWFGEYGKIIYLKSKKYEELEIEYYSWISDSENTRSNFQILKAMGNFTLSISPKNNIRKIKIAV